MPTLADKTKCSLLPGYDRRCKWTQEDKEDVKYLFSLGLSQREISRRTGISRRLISFILFPEREGA